MCRADDVVERKGVKMERKGMKGRVGKGRLRNGARRSSSNSSSGSNRVIQRLPESE